MPTAKQLLLRQAIQIAFWTLCTYGSFLFAQHAGNCDGVIKHLLCDPVELLYLRGPQVHLPFVGAIGFWRGTSTHKICQEMGQVGVVGYHIDWSLKQNMESCTLAIESLVHSWIVWIGFLAYAISILTLLKTVYQTVVQLTDMAILSISIFSTPSVPSVTTTTLKQKMYQQHQQESQSSSSSSFRKLDNQPSNPSAPSTPTFSEKNHHHHLFTTTIKCSTPRTPRACVQPVQPQNVTQSHFGTVERDVQ